MKATSALSLALAAGIASTAAANNTPTTLTPSNDAVRHAGHIYFNVATGEKITTLINVGDTQQPVDGTAGSEIWIADIGQQCLDFGYSTSYFFGMDDPSGTTSLALGMYSFDWGDIAFDTVVDCVQIHWISDHADTDTNSDSVADGVEGFACNWTYWDGMNGRSPQLDSIAQPIVGFTFFSLNGEFPVDTATLVLWTADIDLGATFGTSLTFEIGDTDGDLQGAAFGTDVASNDRDSDSIADIDPDQDGMADWGWSMHFIQPGTSDVDNADSDSDTQTGIDGNPAALATAGQVFGSPNPGHAEFDSIAGSWNWVSDGPTAGATEDAFAIGTVPAPQDPNITIAGTFWFGGLDCSAGQTTGYNPAAHFQVVLYGAGGPGPCAPDINGDGELDFFDVSLFLQTAPDYNGDTAFDFFDVSAFLQDFGLGCP